MRSSSRWWCLNSEAPPIPGHGAPFGHRARARGMRGCRRPAGRDRQARCTCRL
jgi:hypothetical protein